MATVTRYSVAKTSKGYGSAVAGSSVKSETADLRSAYAVPAANTTKLT